MSLVDCSRRWPVTMRSPWEGYGLGFEEPFEDGGLGLLDLEEERIVVAGALEQRHVRTEADAADADDLQRRIDDPVAIEQDAAIFLETLPVSRSGGRRQAGG